MLVILSCVSFNLDFMWLNVWNIWPQCVLCLSGDPTGHRRSAVCSFPIGWKCGHPPGGTPHSTQASDTNWTTASGSTTTAWTGKVSQSPSSSCFLYFFSCGDHGTPCCWTTETAAAFRRWLAIPWLAFLVFWLSLFFQPGVTQVMPRFASVVEVLRKKS